MLELMLVFFFNNLLQLPPPFVTGFNHMFPFDFPILLYNKSPGSGLKITTHFWNFVVDEG